MQAVSVVKTNSISREEWLSERRKGIGGSDAAAILGHNPYFSPLQVYRDKLGLSDSDEDNEAMRFGRDQEPYISSRFTEATGLRVCRKPVLLQHPRYPWMLANIDYRIIGERAGLECKSTRNYQGIDYESGELPMTYRIQGIHYLAVTGWDRWYFAVLVPHVGFYHLSIERDENDIAYLVENERGFWHDHVLAENPPYPVGTDEDGEALDSMYPSATSGEAVSLHEHEADIFQYLEASARGKAAEVERKAAAQRLKMALGDHEHGHTDQYRVSWSNTKAGRRLTIKEVS